MSECEGARSPTPLQKKGRYRVSSSMVFDEHIVGFKKSTFYAELASDVVTKLDST